MNTPELIELIDGKNYYLSSKLSGQLLAIYRWDAQKDVFVSVEALINGHHLTWNIDEIKSWRRADEYTT